MNLKFKSLLFLFCFTSAMLLLSMGKPQNSVKNQSGNPVTQAESKPGENQSAHNALNFVSPLREFTISAEFGMRSHPVLKVSRQHDGIDLYAETGTKVYASEDRVVSFAGRKGGYGKMIEIGHLNNIETRYGHLKEYYVKAGQQVKQGDLIGQVGMTGLTTMSNLHFEIREDDKPVNPRNHIKF